ncbi:excinuclease ATPase subunit [Agaribacter marinus]|uniref:Excinuclease ATPase subunit n=1 Tax=Agaribacter marinus TaxID=1431249 RepID=A0AA37SYE0_9ALTE|nr:excinuclease ATPase subunit [Agaribacter marinus]GLR70754.1 hypothetical protein GCM10007852_16620 [Agaribacter marinus]
MKFLIAISTITLLLVTYQANARDSKYMYPIKEAFESGQFQNRLDPNIKFYWGEQKPTQKIERSFGKYTSNKKTNAFNKSDREACEWVLLSALLSLEERAKREGGNAVINIASYYKKNTVVSETNYECHAGTFIAGVALNGEVVKLAE